MPELPSWLYNKKNAEKHLNIACVTMQCDLKPEVNRKHMAEWIADVLHQHTDVELILFGETILGWYAKRGGSKVYHQTIAEAIPGETTRMMSALAMENSIFLCFGMTETHEGEIFNSQVLINPKGEIEAIHRKYHLMQSASIFKAGKIPVTIVDIIGIRTGIIVCSDIQSSIVRNELKRKNVKLIMGGLANPKDPNFFISGIITKLFDAWILTANRFGEEDGYVYEGDMVIGNPLGQIHQKAVGKEQYLYDELFFLINEPVIKKMLRRIFVGFTFIPYFLKHSRMFLNPLKEKFHKKEVQ